MEQYEYKVLCTEDGQLPSGEQLTEIALDGWRMVTMCSWGISVYIYFERKKNKNWFI